MDEQAQIDEQEMTIEYLYAQEQQRAREATTREEVEKACYYGMGDLVQFEEDLHEW